MFGAIWGAVIGAVLLLGTTAQADCAGKNLLNALPVQAQAELRARAAAHPFAIGNFWLAERDAARIYLIGTYHFDDPRHAATLAQLRPLLKTTRVLLVEAGPSEEVSLHQRLADEPALILNTKGPTLPEVLTPETWQLLSKAVRARGIPPVMVAKLQPWYVSMLLSMPLCGLNSAAAENGLDRQLMLAAAAEAIPIKALEPYDTVLRIFGDMPQSEQLDMVTMALATEASSADMMTTLADSYFAQEGRLIWEFNRLQSHEVLGYSSQRIDADLAKMEQVMMIDRNRAWIAKIEAAAQQGQVLAAFGALHLSGEAGVLRLLEQQGYHISRQPLP